MKVFRYNPATGQRGDLIDEIPVATYTGQGAAHQGYCFPPPAGEVGSEWTIHVDAGTYGESYLRDEWICFCLGRHSAGRDDPGIWQWVVLPPRQALQSVPMAVA
ncbi:MAG: hypothetical protein LAT62_11285 [Natronospirillum sp.]|uniref:hypothetical protein n=1 Tax=Natronospirillum sp. TaxID=2812955 RepID=UPI0025F584C4|nr:hypothetical protein [Natronospirillum sp.]MCH8552513.1 hypothetical protein [Natronospirillum sp.]